MKHKTVADYPRRFAFSGFSLVSKKSAQERADCAQKNISSVVSVL
jgi:hypothetical protein